MDIEQKSDQYNQSENSIQILDETIETLQSNISQLRDVVTTNETNRSLQDKPKHGPMEQSIETEDRPAKCNKCD